MALLDRPDESEGFLKPASIPEDFPLNEQFQIAKFREDIKRASPDQLRAITNDLMICYIRAQLMLKQQMIKGLGIDETH